MQMNGLIEVWSNKNNPREFPSLQGSKTYTMLTLPITYWSRLCVYGYLVHDRIVNLVIVSSLTYRYMQCKLPMDKHLCTCFNIVIRRNFKFDNEFLAFRTILTFLTQVGFVRKSIRSEILRMYIVIFLGRKFSFSWWWGSEWKMRKSDPQRHGFRETVRLQDFRHIAVFSPLLPAL